MQCIVNIIHSSAQRFVYSQGVPLASPALGGERLTTEGHVRRHHHHSHPYLHRSHHCHRPYLHCSHTLYLHRSHHHHSHTFFWRKLSPSLFRSSSENFIQFWGNRCPYHWSLSSPDHSSYPQNIKARNWQAGGVERGSSEVNNVCSFTICCCGSPKVNFSVKSCLRPCVTGFINYPDQQPFAWISGLSK